MGKRDRRRRISGRSGPATRANAFIGATLVDYLIGRTRGLRTAHRAKRAGSRRWYDVMVELSRFRTYLPREKRTCGGGKYIGWLSGRRMTRKAFAEASGVPMVTLKQIELKGVKPRAKTIAKIEKLMAEVRATEQQEILPPNRAAEKVAARAERERDRWLDSILAKARRPMSKKAKQGGLF